MNRPTIVAPFIAAALALSACSSGPAASPLDDARTQNQARHVAERFAPHPVVLDDPYGFETSRLFFPASETVVVTDSTPQAQLRGASIAVTAHAPLLVYAPERHGEVLEEIQRLGAHTVLTIGDVAFAPASGQVTVQRDPGGLDALHTMTSLEFDVRDIEDTADARETVAAVASLAGNPPVWLRTREAPATKPGAQAAPFPLQSRRDADMAPVVVATPASPLPAVSNARSFGARVAVVDEPDPRQSRETLLALAGLANEPLIALGPEFGTEQELSRHIMQAEEYY